MLKPSPDELQPDIDTQEAELHGDLVTGILYLTGQCGWTYEDVGLAMGYSKGGARQQVDKIVNQGWTPPMKRCKPISRAMSRRGFDRVAEHFSAPEKHVIPSEVSASSRANLCIADDVRAVTQSSGVTSLHVESESWVKAEEEARVLVAASMEYLDEVIRIRKHGHARAYGDSLPAEPALAPS